MLAAAIAAVATLRRHDTDAAVIAYVATPPAPASRSLCARFACHTPPRALITPHTLICRHAYTPPYAAMSLRHAIRPPAPCYCALVYMPFVSPPRQRRHTLVTLSRVIHVEHEMVLCAGSA